MNFQLLEIKILGELKGSIIPNGITSLSVSENAVLISDSTLSNIWHFDLSISEYKLWISDPYIKKINETIGSGINGLRIHDGKYLYFTNSYGPFLARIPITTKNGSLVFQAQTEILGYAPLGTMLDDFSVDEDSGVVYVVSGTANSVLKVRNGVVSGVVGGEGLRSPISVRFGRGEVGRTRRRIYVTTCGGLEDANTTLVTGAQLVAITLE